MFELEFGEGDGGAAKTVGLDHVGAGGEIAFMDVADEVGAGEVQDFGAVFLVPIVFFGVQGEGLHARAHAAVAEEDGFGEGFEEVGFLGHGCEIHWNVLMSRI